MSEDQLAPAASNPSVPDAPTRSGPPHGFGKDVNDYLNHYITVMDAKAGGFLAACLLMLDFMSDRTYQPVFSIPFHTMAIVGFILGTAMSSLCLLPRLPRGKKGLIFWEDIRERGGPDAYARDTHAMDERLCEREYAWQNYFVSQVLHKKCRLMQWTIGITLASALCLLVAEF